MRQMDGKHSLTVEPTNKDKMRDGRLAVPFFYGVDTLTQGPPASTRHGPDTYEHAGVHWVFRLRRRTPIFEQHTLGVPGL